MPFDPKKLIELLRTTNSKEKKKGSMFYLPEALDEEFREVCGKGNASIVLELLIRNFLEDLEKDRGK